MAAPEQQRAEYAANSSRDQRADPRLGRVLKGFARFPRALPISIFLAIAALTATGVWAIEKSQREARRNELNQIATAASAALERRANANAAYLRSGAALLATQKTIAPELFQNFVGQLRLDANFRGAEGIGWAARVDSDAIAAFEAQQRGAGQQSFTIHPRPTPDVAYAVPVAYLQPLTERNRKALGYNMFSERVRRAAMLEAERLARPTTSGKVVLVQEAGGEGEPGFLSYMPVFGIDAAGKRPLKGYVYSPFNAREFLESSLEGELPERARIEIYDGEVAPENLLAEMSTGEAGGESLTRPIVIGNRDWTMRVHSIRTSLLSDIAVITLLAGLIVATLALAIAWLLTRQAVEARQVIGILEEQAAIRNTLTRELNHRVKNTLANVLSIVSLTRRRATDIDSFATSLDGRIRALSATHDLLTQSEWGTTPVRSVVEVEMAPYALGRDAAVEMDGPHVELAPNDALSLGLAIHELATNAAKFGALSVPQGRVEVHWDLVADNLVRVRWRESGGPEVPVHRPKGFGTELIEKIVAHELRNPVDLVFEPGGVRCTMLIPVRNRGDFAIRART
ncbi:CHASE domain-containing protein [Croceicoccus sp. BE223]|uniref:CHASE domain-containing protein n=1 Tax=Croceicoccus sp. BE223 TaxID=2817716 RepID=UPI00286242F3|nr:CHASE domain-containing protein [Croceicoccus sp. BE223]MDR7103601.1 two-component sensor histidine kinase/CHASE1-domain containing sensor protein [Croceicoccus sp. BE223]